MDLNFWKTTIVRHICRIIVQALCLVLAHCWPWVLPPDKYLSSTSSLNYWVIIIDKYSKCSWAIPLPIAKLLSGIVYYSHLIFDVIQLVARREIHQFRKLLVISCIPFLFVKAAYPSSCITLVDPACHTIRSCFCYHWINLVFLIQDILNGNMGLQALIQIVKIWLGNWIRLLLKSC